MLIFSKLNNGFTSLLNTRFVYQEKNPEPVKDQCALKAATENYATLTGKEAEARADSYQSCLDSADQQSKAVEDEARLIAEAKKQGQDVTDMGDIGFKNEGKKSKKDKGKEKGEEKQEEIKQKTYGELKEQIRIKGAEGDARYEAENMASDIYRTAHRINELLNSGNSVDMTAYYKTKEAGSVNVTKDMSIKKIAEMIIQKIYYPIAVEIFKEEKKSEDSITEGVTQARYKKRMETMMTRVSTIDRDYNKLVA